MLAFVVTHWLDILIHLGLDVSGGLSLKCAMGMCEHKRHQNLVWLLGCVLISISTVAMVG
jgi:hypothetical protein